MSDVKKLKSKRYLLREDGILGVMILDKFGNFQEEFFETPEELLEFIKHPSNIRFAQFIKDTASLF